MKITQLCEMVLVALTSSGDKIGIILLLHSCEKNKTSKTGNKTINITKEIYLSVHVYGFPCFWLSLCMVTLIDKGQGWLNCLRRQGDP